VVWSLICAGALALIGACDAEVETPSCDEAWNKALGTCLTDDGDPDYALLQSSGVEARVQDCGSAWLNTPLEVEPYRLWVRCVKHPSTTSCPLILACTSGAEVCYDEQDNDGDGRTDCQDPACCDDEVSGGASLCAGVGACIEPPP
jgi:hypothetical protein